MTFILSILRAASIPVLLIASVKAGETVPPDHAKNMARGLELFKGGVRELFVTHCLKCHGEAGKTKGGLDLSTREDLIRGGGEGPAVVAGNHTKSLLYKMVNHDEEPAMPEKQPKLPADAIAKIAAWIDAGAPYDKPLIEKKTPARDKSIVTAEDRKHWSFAPLNPAAARGAAFIDRYINEKLTVKNLKQNPRAEKRVLLRRASLDLTGLPPTPEELTAFENDTAPDAFEKIIDRLLDSPQYGERWGRHWLDLARFAESHGYEQDYDRPNAYHYRDFVIRALNADIPYDQFVQWQLAGDELAPENPQAWMATGFLAAGTHATQITLNQAEKERYDELDDKGATTGTAFLGLTVGCARCHDHKFDPIPDKDYYRFISTFTATVRSDHPLELEPEKNRAAREKFEAELKPIVAARDHYGTTQLGERFEQWLRTAPKFETPRWIIADFATATATSQSAFNKQPDGSYIVAGLNNNQDTYTLTIRTAQPRLTALKLEALADASLVKYGPGRADNGNFALSNLTVRAKALNGDANVTAVKLVNPRATFEQGGLPVSAAIDSDAKSSWAIDPKFGQDHAAVFDFAQALEYPGGAELTVTLEFKNNAKHSIGRLRIALSTNEKPALDGEALPQHVLEGAQTALSKPATQRIEADRMALFELFKQRDAVFAGFEELLRHKRANAPRPVMTHVLVCSENLPAVRLHTQGPDFYPRTFFLKRGDLAQKQGEAEPGFLQVLSRPPADGGGKRWFQTPPPGARTPHRRAALARWITDVDHGAGHLLARVIVNRLWQHHFGRGIVATPSDFGHQGERPTHPELLDALAQELIANGWRLKPIHKLMLASATYRQSSAWDAPRAALDPDNALHWRRNVQRLEGEVLRDAILAVSGTLDLAPFGPGTLHEGMKRRSIYFTVKRSKLISLMSLFDGPDTLQGLPRRATTVVAPQAMALMNNPHIRTAAMAFGQRLWKEGAGSIEKSVERGYVLTLGRSPDPDEKTAALAFIAAQRDEYAKSGKQNAAETALGNFAQALISLNEFAYVD